MTDTITAQAADRKRRLKKTVFAVSLGGVVGFVGAMAGMELAETGALGEFDASREIALLVGLFYVLIALIILAGIAVPRAGATFLNVEDAEEIQEQRPMLTLSGIGTAVAGAALIVVALGGANGVLDPLMAVAAYAILGIVAVVVSLRSMKLQDELMVAMGRQAGATAFYLVALVGGTWAVLAHLGFVTGPTPLDWLTMIWALMLLAAFIVVAKKGMMVMR
ncbi:hypothetical protein GRI62_02395 [Erythrobacter arachoides]|uniref:Uncharacterized protein n=1 Tax=Aurantiacibacter arachoides TaxID=1850444 RepID=A0A844ZX35_9SPHN|nr:hypothetical protein [Aurantiacibacter arachoides]MXO92455.1 hypothetical protein [Aurantiacibacter arachoides]GGD57048.1 hypothetical protein GCM10011411_16340 [Aurantiacibacter arachoides]